VDFKIHFEKENPLAKLTIAEELDSAIKLVSAQFEGLSSREAAEEFYMSQPELVT